MDADTKYKRWGWGAIVGLIGVILIAGLVVAVTMSSPKPNAEVASDDSNTSVSEEIATSNGAKGANGEQKSEEEKAAEEKKAAEERKAAEEKKAAEERAAQEKAEAEAKAAEDAKKKEAAGSTDKTGEKADDSSDKVATSDTKKMPKTGPEDNLLTIVAFAVIAGLIAYNISLKRQA